MAVSRGLAESLAGTGITVNCVLPGPTRSRGVEDFVATLAKAEGKSFAEFEKGFFEKVRPTSVIRRFGTPEEVASLVAYVASPLASATTGASLRVDGDHFQWCFIEYRNLLLSALPWSVAVNPRPADPFS